MISQTYKVEFITPCFCAGANQAVAEVRPASIRGQLRWWFRALGGSSADEALLFGSAAGQTGSASRVRITVSEVKPSAQRSLPLFSPNQPESYVWHYARVSGTTARGMAGPRWQAQGALPAGTTFNLHVAWVRDPKQLKSAFEETLAAFLTLGTLGLRATRGLGAFHCGQKQDTESVVAAVRAKSFTVVRRTDPDNFNDYASALRDWASWLRYRLRKEHKAERPSPLGSSDPRQASSVHFRPLRGANGKIAWLAFEPPADRVLAPASRRNRPLLSNYTFSGPAPQPEPRSRRC
jgi:CRISPR type III-B/RAMP module RAMP protein Cmr1